MAEPSTDEIRELAAELTASIDAMIEFVRWAGPLFWKQESAVPLEQTWLYRIMMSVREMAEWRVQVAELEEELRFLEQNLIAGGLRSTGSPT